MAEGVLTGVEMIATDVKLPRRLTPTIGQCGNGSTAVLCCDDEDVVVLRVFEILKGCAG